MAVKITARQVPPEYQESPLFWGDWPEDVELTGNDRLRERVSDRFRYLEDNLYDLIYAWEDLQSGVPQYNESWEAALARYAPPEGRPAYTREERKHVWPELLERWQDCPDDRDICDALTLITGQRWDVCTLRGCSQGDWQCCYYNAERWSGDALERLEMEYFNTGSEWHVYDGDDLCTSVYCYEWSNDGIRREIADAAGVSPEDVTLQKFTGYERIAQYEEV